MSQICFQGHVVTEHAAVGQVWWKRFDWGAWNHRNLFGFGRKSKKIILQLSIFELQRPKLRFMLLQSLAYPKSTSISLKKTDFPRVHQNFSIKIGCDLVWAPEFWIIGISLNLSIEKFNAVQISRPPNTQNFCLRLILLSIFAKAENRLNTFLTSFSRHCLYNRQKAPIIYTWFSLIAHILRKFFFTLALETLEDYFIETKSEISDFDERLPAFHNFYNLLSIFV